MFGLSKYFCFLLLSFCFSCFSLQAQDPQSLIREMMVSGFDPGKADLLYGQWDEVKPIMHRMAKSGDRSQIDMAAEIVSNRYDSFENTWTSRVKQWAAKSDKPIEAMVPTGGWKKPLALRNSSDPADKVRFIIDGSNADIDATMFGKTEVVEDVVDDILVDWAEKTTGRSLRRPDGVDYDTVNNVMRRSEVTVFPRHPEGKMSPEFKAKYPEVVHESYPGAAGQRSLEVTYMLDRKKAKADIVRYDRKGKLIVKGGEVQVLRDQPAENVIEDLSKARYDHLSRSAKLDADFELKYKKHMQGLNKSGQDELTAKMLERMIVEESSLKGYKPQSHPLFDKAQQVKKALRESDDAAIKQALGSQSLDDFVSQARGEINRIGGENKMRLTEMMDDAFVPGRSGENLDQALKGAGRADKAARALTVLGYGYDAADAYLKARKGEKGVAVGKALVAAVAADAAASSAGAAAGGAVAAAGGGGILSGAAAVGSGIGAAVVAGAAVSCGLDYTEQGIKNIMGGYKADASVEKIFLTGDKIKDFSRMTPAQIKKEVEKYWDSTGQWGGAYYGKMGDKEEQQNRVREIYEKALETQDRLVQGLVRNQVTADIFADELAKIYDKFRQGKIDVSELEKEKKRLRDGLPGIVSKRLEEKEYRAYKDYFQEAEKKAEKRGIWDRIVNQDKNTPENRARADAHIQDMRDTAEIIESIISDFDAHYAQLNSVYKNDPDPETMLNIFASMRRDHNDLIAQMSVLRRKASSLMKELHYTFAQDDDLTGFYERRGQVAGILNRFSQLAREKQDLYAALKQVFTDFKKKDKERKKKIAGAEQAEAKEKDGDKDGPDQQDADKDENVPVWVRESKVKKKEDQNKDQNKDKPAFVSRSGTDRGSDLFREEPDPEPEFRDEFRIKAVSADTVDRKKDGKIYLCLKTSDSATVIISMRGRDRIIEGKEAVALLMEKGYFYYLAGAGIVASEKYDSFFAQKKENRKKLKPVPLPEKKRQAQRSGSDCSQVCAAADACRVRLKEIEAEYKGSRAMRTRDYWDKITCPQRIHACEQCRASGAKKKKTMDNIYGVREMPEDQLK